MSDEYWILVENRRWRFFSWPRVKSAFVKQCTFDEIKEFVDGLRKEFSNDPYEYTFRVGVTRGKHIIMIH